MLFFAEGFTFRNFLADAFAVFAFVVLFWLLIVVFGERSARTGSTSRGRGLDLSARKP